MDDDGKGDDVIVEDWLWGDDAPEEGDEEPLTQSEIALRKRMISIFIGSVIAGIALIILGDPSYLGGVNGDSQSRGQGASFHVRESARREGAPLRI